VNAAAPPPSRGAAPSASKCSTTTATPGRDFMRNLCIAYDGGANASGIVGRHANDSRHASGGVASLYAHRTLHPAAPGPGAPG
jgi:hypothetical protein